MQIVYNKRGKGSKDNRVINERVIIMEVAKISGKGQITIPIAVRNKLNLKTGDKVVIFEENGRFCFENSATLALKNAKEAFAGEAQKAGFETEEEMQDFEMMQAALRLLNQFKKDKKSIEEEEWLTLGSLEHRIENVNE